MFLSRLVLNVRNRQVRADLDNCQAMHRRLLDAFPSLETRGAENQAPGARARLGLLFRLDSDPRTRALTLLAQSAVEPAWSRLPEGYLAPDSATRPNPMVKEVDRGYQALQRGQVLRFRLRANPTKRLGKQGGMKEVDRPGMRVALLTEAGQLDWLARKAETAGFRLLDVEQDAVDVWFEAGADPVHVPDVRRVDEPPLTGRKTAGDGRQTLTFGSALFEGRLQIEDADRFRAALAAGIGSAKAYGFGLLSVARA